MAAFSYTELISSCSPLICQIVFCIFFVSSWWTLLSLVLVNLRRNDFPVFTAVLYVEFLIHVEGWQSIWPPVCQSSGCQDWQWFHGLDISFPMILIEMPMSVWWHWLWVASDALCSLEKVQRNALENKRRLSISDRCPQCLARIHVVCFLCLRWSYIITTIKYVMKQMNNYHSG